MGKLTKRQLKAHQQARDLLAKDELTYSEKWFVYENWHEGADHNISVAGAFFTPLSLACDFGLDVSGPRIIDLCAGIGSLAFAYYHTKAHRYGEDKLDITCVEMNPAYVEIGKKLLPEATWICGNVFEVVPQLGRFDYAISNPPFGKVRTGGQDCRRYEGAEFEFKVIDLASEIARNGTFLIPQGSAPFRYSGAHYYDRHDGGRSARFTQQTGIEMEAGVGVDTSVHADEWKTTTPLTEIVCCDFTLAPHRDQFELFGPAAA